jgi:hypothetical protein
MEYHDGSECEGDGQPSVTVEIANAVVAQSLKLLDAHPRSR